MTFDFSVILQYRDAFILGLLTSLKFTAICIFLGLILGFLLSLMRTSKNKILYLLSTVYIEFFRCTPVLVQLFWFFFCLPLILGIDISNFISAIISLTLYMGAISSMTFVSSLKSIEDDQLDACVALGLSRWTKILYVILPQAVLRAIPTLLSNAVSLFKESSLVSAVGMADLMFVGQNISNQTARPVEILTTVAILYFLIAFPLTRGVTKIETRLLQKVRA